MVDDEENMDLDSLQAQIDMSMSFAQDLVSSWIQPSKVTTTSRSLEIEKELKEYMRRPPRLGVGAPVPEVNGLSKEAVRLKGKLLDKVKLKRSPEEEKGASESDSQEESKAKAVKKRAKLDPFAGLSRSKKKLKNNQTSRGIPASRGTMHENQGISGSATGQLLVHQGSPAISPISETQGASIAKTLSTAVLIFGGGPSTFEPPGCESQLDGAQALLVPNTTELEPSHSCSLPSSLRTTVLNLKGPPSDEHAETENATSTGGQSHRKRRRRRKKRKCHLE